MLYNAYFVLEHFLGYSGFQKVFGKGRQQLYNKIADDLNGHTIDMLPEIVNLDKEIVNKEFKMFKQHIQEPVVFRGAAKGWPCIGKWSLDFFEDKYGDVEVPIIDNVGAVDPANPQKFEKIQLREYISQLRNGSLKYLKFSTLVQQKAELQEDLHLKWLQKFDMPLSFGRMFYFFIGGAKTLTPLHNELPAVVYVQVSGRKRWIIYTAGDRIFLDPRTERRIYFYSTANPNNENDENFPILKYAKKYDIVLEPGDVLWFPPFAWHYVENLTHSIGVAYKFNNLPAAFKASKMLTSLFLMATRPNLLVNFFTLRFSKKNALTKSHYE